MSTIYHDAIAGGASNNPSTINTPLGLLDDAIEGVRAGTLALRKLNIGGVSSATISGGAITFSTSNMKIDTEGAAASDDLDTINGGAAGVVIYLQSNNSARDITIRHGVGNIKTTGETNITLDTTDRRVGFISDGTTWYQISGKTAPKASAYAYNNANISHTSSGGWQAVTFNTTAYEDVSTMHDGGGATPGRIVAPISGKYLLESSIQWASNATGVRGIRIKINGTVVAQDDRPTMSGGMIIHLAKVYTLTASQYIEVETLQSSGGNLNMVANGTVGIAASLTYLGEI